MGTFQSWPITEAAGGRGQRMSRWRRHHLGRAIISITGNLNILVLSGSRVPFAMAEQQQLPSFIAQFIEDLRPTSPS